MRETGCVPAQSEGMTLPTFADSTTTGTLPGPWQFEQRNSLLIFKPLPRCLVKAATGVAILERLNVRPKNRAVDLSLMPS